MRRHDLGCRLVNERVYSDEGERISHRLVIQACVSVRREEEGVKRLSAVHFDIARFALLYFSAIVCTVRPERRSRNLALINSSPVLLFVC